MPAKGKQRQQLGRLGEELAARLLERRGYIILARNYRCPQGEVDLVAQEGEHLVFVEVRARRGRAYGSPEESLRWPKGERLAAVAEHYLQDYGDQRPPWRIDLVAIELSPAGKLLRIEIIPNAVEAAG